MASGRFADYLGMGVIADRPAAPVLLSYMVGLWYSTDTNEWSAWDGSVWLEDIMGGAGMTNPMTTAEDIIVGGVAGAPARLGVGANGTFLGVAAGVVGWATPSGSGDVVGPASAVADRIAVYDGTTGKLIKDGGVTVAVLAPLASPTFTGTPSAPTASAGTSTTQLATTAFVNTLNVQSIASSSTPTPTSVNDMLEITALAANMTLTNPTGSMQDGWGLVVRIKDNATPRTIAYGTQYRALGVTLPTTTVASKTLYLGMIWNGADTIFDITAVAQQA